MARNEIPAGQTEPLPTITIGTVFNTPFESGCIALTTPDELGWFDATDSEGVTVSFCLTVGGIPIEVER